MGRGDQTQCIDGQSLMFARKALRSPSAKDPQLRLSIEQLQLLLDNKSWGQLFSALSKQLKTSNDQSELMNIVDLSRAKLFETNRSWANSTWLEQLRSDQQFNQLIQKHFIDWMGQTKNHFFKADAFERQNGSEHIAEFVIDAWQEKMDQYADYQSARESIGPVLAALPSELGSSSFNGYSTQPKGMLVKGIIENGPQWTQDQLYSGLYQQLVEQDKSGSWAGSGGQLRVIADALGIKSKNSSRVVKIDHKWNAELHLLQSDAPVTFTLCNKNPAYRRKMERGHWRGLQLENCSVCAEQLLQLQESGQADPQLEESTNEVFSYSVLSEQQEQAVESGCKQYLEQRLKKALAEDVLFEEKTIKQIKTGVRNRWSRLAAEQLLSEMERASGDADQMMRTNLALPAKTSRSFTHKQMLKMISAGLASGKRPKSRLAHQALQADEDLKVR